ncbi:hypothetical protein [Streptomyces uncialis]|uniref:hypothetical protein n=1 Tax=Streptomyces uncialis TaxID=1048205 RepID=UPI0022563600|nr:hypothetical protein [Streptomyces uncialis]MCX4661480.1 hypothetical protein [Streptomyces uncialis]
MTGRPVPTPPTPGDGPPTPDPPPSFPPGWPVALYGLWVDCGHWHRGYWLRIPRALFLCRHGCVLSVSGHAHVAHLTTHLTELHQNCPGPTELT